jgi:hypothetical protein
MRRFLYLLLFVLTFWITYKHLRPVVHAQTSCFNNGTIGWNDCGSGTKMTNLSDTACGGVCGAGAASGGPYAYSGGFWDSLRSRMIVWGGGHTDNYTNMQFAFTLTGTPASSKITAPTAHGCATNFSVVGYSCDGGVTPNDRHSYSIIAYYPPGDGMFINGGAQSTIGQTNGDWWYFSYASGAYTYLNPITTCVNVSASGPCFEVAQGSGWDPNNTLNNFSNNGDGVLAYDPNSGLMWTATVDGMIATYNLSTHTLTQVSASNLVGNSTCGYNYTVGTIDASRKRFWLFAHTCNVLGYVDITSNATANVFHVLNPQPTGGVLGGSPGMEYDPVSHHIVFWNGGASVLDYNPDTNTSTSISFAGGGPPVGAAEESGRTFKRFSYMYGPGNAALSTCGECFAVNNGGAIDEFVLRVSNGSPDTTPPSNPSSLTATAISSSQINLAWTGSTDNVAVGGYNVEQCSGGGCSNFAQVNTTATNSYSVTGLTASTSYSYRVRTFDTTGNLSGYSNTATATTQAPDTTPPTAPSSLTATAVSSSQINLSFSASSDAVGVTRYRVERCSGGGCSTFVEVAQINGAPPVTTFSDQALNGSTSYSYRVRANDIAGNLSGYSNTATDTTQMAPATTTLVDFLGVTAGIGPVTHTDTYALTGWTTTVMDNYTDEFTRGGVSGAVQYYTNTQRYNFQGVKTATNPRVFVPGEIITATWYNNDTIPVTLNPLISFKCENRSFNCDSTAPWFPMTSATIAAGATGTTSYTVDGTSTGTYSLVNVASELGGQQVLILDKIVLQPSGSNDVTAPTNPSSLIATSITQSQINLSWTGSTDATGVTSYLIERCSGGACSPTVQVATVNGAPPVTVLSDTGLATNTPYGYRVRASDAAANLSGYSNTATATTMTNSDATAPSTPASLNCTVISYRQVNCSWAASTDNVAVTGYTVENCAGVGCVNFALDQVVSGTPPTPAASDYNLAIGTTNSWRVKATDAAGNFSGYSNIVTATTQSPGPLQVGNDKQYTTLAAAYTAANNGDTIEVDYNTSTTPGTSYDIAKCLTIRGVGPPGTRASFPWDGGNYNNTVANGGTGTNPVSNDQGIFRIFPGCVLPQLVTLENLEVSGAYGASGNTAAVRYANTTDITLTNLYLHDNEVGVLGGNSLTDTLTTTADHNVIIHNGAADGSEHNVYIGEQDHLIFRYNKVSNAIGGHNLKSRARRNEVYSNFITSQTGAEGSSESPVDFPCGGDIYFIGNVVEQGVNSSYHGLFQSAEEHGSNCGGGYSPTNRVYVVNNTFYNYYGGGNFLDVITAGGPTPTFVSQNNIFANGGTLYNTTAPTLASNNNTTATSADFVASDSGNYRLVAGASEINAGTNPGTANGISLTPTTIYLDPAMSDVRPVAAPLDIGAYEFNGAPTPGNAGNFSPTTNVTQNSLALNWTKGSDAVSPQNTLQYAVYKSTTNNITTVANMLANGTIVVGLTTDIATANISALNCGTTTFFNVLIQNQAGTQAAYNGTSQVTLGCTTHAGRSRIRR